MTQSAQLRKKIVVSLICLTFLLALAGFLLEIKVKADGVLLLSLVILGTGYDFLGAHLGTYTRNKKTLLFFTKTRFSLLNFGIIFTPLSAVFILNRLSAPAMSSTLVSYYGYLLVFSLITGALFLFTKYNLAEKDGVLTYKLDRNDRFTSVAFIIRRVVLLLSLVIALISIFEGLQSELAVWTLLYGGLFIATVPLHILHKELSSMAAEYATLVVLFYGAYMVYTV